MNARSAGGSSGGEGCTSNASSGASGRDRHAVGQAGEVRCAVAGDDAVVDHLEMRRQHGRMDLGDALGRHAALDDLA